LIPRIQTAARIFRIEPKKVAELHIDAISVTKTFGVWTPRMQREAVQHFAKFLDRFAGVPILTRTMCKVEAQIQVECEDQLVSRPVRIPRFCGLHGLSLLGIALYVTGRTTISKARFYEFQFFLNDVVRLICSFAKLASFGKCQDEHRFN
jgi:hypothetical protein